ncbi:hypothetical protein [Streptomyces sp. NPDC056982]|uniref:hypothetical protein n=1 Tax=unclassified Streptomyces TaxID=2593676 RepID=UPI00362FAEC5
MLPSPSHPVIASARLAAQLDVACPERLSRGLVLMKWWLLAIPHCLVIGFFAGSVRGGVIGMLALVTVVTLAFRALPACR